MRWNKRTICNNNQVKMAEKFKRRTPRDNYPVKDLYSLSSTRIFIRNLPSQVTEKEIHLMFDPIGSVKDIFFCIKDEKKLYVFLDMDSIVEARAAINYYNDSKVNGRVINVRTANPRKYQYTNKNSQSSIEEEDMFSFGGKISEVLLSLQSDEESQVALEEFPAETKKEIKRQTEQQSDLKVFITPKKKSKSFSKKFNLKEKISLFSNSENYSFNQ